MKGLDISSEPKGALPIAHEPTRRRRQGRTLFVIASVALLLVGLFHTTFFQSHIPCAAHVFGKKHHHKHHNKHHKDHKGHKSHKHEPSAALPSPTVVLDYCTVAPAKTLDNLEVYKYQNIRYAAVPTGDLRWSKPEWPPVEEEVNIGNLVREKVECSVEEDCLYLDIYVPKNPTKKKLPIMTFTYGSGFYCCAKTDHPPDGFFELSNDFIFVGYNHRIGIGGLANSPTFVHEGGLANALLWDVEHAYKWIKKYIHHFGGDPDQVTAFGYSAGSAIIMSQMVRYAGHNEQLYNRAYIVSPGFTPSAGHAAAEVYWQDLAARVGCPGGSIDCMRKVEYTELMARAINSSNDLHYVLEPRVDGVFLTDTLDYQFYRGAYNFTGPVVITNGNHEVGPAGYPGINSTEDLLREITTWFPSMPKVFIDEALKLYPEDEWSDPSQRFSEMRQAWDLTGHTFALTQAMHNRTWNGINYLSKGEHGADQAYYWYPTFMYDDCEAMFNISSSEKVDIKPYVNHGEFHASETYDLDELCRHPYYDPDNPDPDMPTPTSGSGSGSAGGVMGPIPTLVNVHTARTMQKYLMSFVLTGNPNTLWPDEKIYWPTYNSTNPGTVLIINDTFRAGQFDEWANERSWFWNKALYY